MNYRSVGNRCAVNFEDLKLPIDDEKALKILRAQGFHQIHINHQRMIDLIRECIPGSTYVRGASASQAPFIMDCSSMMKWAYGLRGIYLPRHSIAQRDYCPLEVPTNEMQIGDLVFATGYRNYYWEDPENGVGHVGIVTGDGSIIHAANSKRNIIECPLDDFVNESNNRGIWRVIPDENKVYTMESPADKHVEESYEFRWRILQHC